MPTVFLSILVLLLQGWVHAKPAIDNPSTSVTAAIVTKVKDGDSVDVYVAENGQMITLRLRDIDTPELNQPYGNQARRVLQKKILRKKIQFIDHGIDKYNRTLATILYDNQSVNQWMVSNGHAWAYRKYLPANDPMLAAEQKAKERKLGLWQMENPLAPWEWRQNQRKTMREVAKITHSL